MKLSYWLSIWKIIKIQGLMSVVRDWRSFIRMNFLFAAIDAGLLEALINPRSKQDLRTRLNAQRPEILDALLDVGLSLGEIKLKDDRYHLKGKRSLAVAGTDGDMLTALIQAQLTYYTDAYREAGNRIRGASLGDDINTIGTLVARFSKIGEPLLGAFMHELVAAGKPIRVLDVGCGSGIFLKQAYLANSEACGIGLDLDEAVVEQAQQNIAAWGLDHKFKIITGDIRLQAEILADRYDLVTLFNILYYFKPDERLPILKKIRSLLSPTGQLAIAMNFQSQGKDLAAANLNLVNCSLEGLTGLPHLKDLKRLLKESGYADIRMHRLMPSSTFYGLTASASDSR